MSTPVTNNRIFRLGDLPRSVAGRVVKLPREMADSVGTRGREVWLAGLGALATVEEEGTQLFTSLVKQGGLYARLARRQSLDGEPRTTVATVA